MQSNSLLRKEARLEALVEAARRLISSKSTEEGWCLVAFGGCGILLVRRTNVTARLLFSSSARKAKLNCGEAAAWACFRHTQPSARIAHNSGVARLHCLSRVDVSQPQAWEDSVLQGRKQTALAWA
jgi:hypothetical protein